MLIGTHIGYTLFILNAFPYTENGTLSLFIWEAIE